MKIILIAGGNKFLCIQWQANKRNFLIFIAAGMLIGKENHCKLNDCIPYIHFIVAYVFLLEKNFNLILCMIERQFKWSTL